MPIAWSERMNQKAKIDGESRIHVLRPLSSIVLKIKGTAKLHLLEQRAQKHRLGIVYSAEKRVNGCQFEFSNNPLTYPTLPKIMTIHLSAALKEGR